MTIKGRRQNGFVRVNTLDSHHELKLELCQVSSNVACCWFRNNQNEPENCALHTRQARATGHFFGKTKQLLSLNSRSLLIVFGLCILMLRYLQLSTFGLVCAGFEVLIFMKVKEGSTKLTIDRLIRKVSQPRGRWLQTTTSNDWDEGNNQLLQRLVQ